MSILKTRFKLYAWIIAAWRSVGDQSSPTVIRRRASEQSPCQLHREACSESRRRFSVGGRGQRGHAQP